jgi:hypothetical protein
MQLNPVYLASLIIGVGVVGFVVLSWMLGHMELTPEWMATLIILRHGCEGALVGGICDIIAVQNVYSTARKHFPGLRDNTTRIVVQDMIRVRHQLETASQLQNLLSNPVYQQEFVTLLESVVPDQVVVEEKVRELWTSSVRSHLIDWLVAYSFQGTAQEFTNKYEIDTEVFRQAGVEILRGVANKDTENAELVVRLRQLAADVNLHDIGVPAETEAVRHLLTKIWEQWKSLSPQNEENLFSRMGNGLANQVILKLAPAIARKVQTTTLEDAIDPILSEEGLKSTLLSLADKLNEDSPERQLLQEHSDLLEDIVSYWWVFAHAWDDLDPELKRKCVEEVLRVIEEPAISGLTAELWAWRMQLLDPQAFLEKEVTRQLLDVIGGYLKEQSLAIEERSISLLQAEFDAMGADGFVDMLQRNTKRQLDWIKVNGSAWGFGLGALVGLIGWLLEHYQSTL